MRSWERFPRLTLTSQLLTSNDRHNVELYHHFPGHPSSCLASRDPRVTAATPPPARVLCGRRGGAQEAPKLFCLSAVCIADVPYMALQREKVGQFGR